MYKEKKEQTSVGNNGIWKKYKLWIHYSRIYGMNNKKDAYLHSKGNNWYDFWGEQYIIFVSCKRYKHRNMQWNIPPWSTFFKLRIHCMWMAAVAYKVN